MTAVRMINSVDEYVAGDEVDLPEDVADRFILLGYAEGVLSRDYNDEERSAVTSRAQSVSV